MLRTFENVNKTGLLAILLTYANIPCVLYTIANILWRYFIRSRATGGACWCELLTLWREERCGNAWCLWEVRSVFVLFWIHQHRQDTPSRDPERWPTETTERTAKPHLCSTPCKGQWTTIWRPVVSIQPTTTTAWSPSWTHPLSSRSTGEVTCPIYVRTMEDR